MPSNDDSCRDHPSAARSRPSPEAYIDWTVEIVANFVSNNTISSADMPGLIAATYAALTGLDATGEQVPAVPISESVYDAYLVCLEDGRKLKSLRRYLRRNFGISPEDYRRKWSLPADYPMVAPAYSRARSEIARRLNLPRDSE